MRTAPVRTILGVAALVLASALPAQAGLADLIPGLFDQRIVLADPPPGSPFSSHAAHFLDGASRLNATGAALNGSLISQLATFPIGSSAGGFTFTYDSTLGVFNRSSESFGPVFAERSQSLGRGKWNAGISYLTAEYDELDGLDLGSGEIAFPLIHQDVNNDGSQTSLFFEGDVILARSRIQVETDTTVVFATYGVTDRFDLGVAVPIISIDLAAQADLSIERLSTATSSPPIHVFPEGTALRTTRAAGSASGIGDVVLRGKYRLLGGDAGGLAAALDLRLPTGQEDDLLGTGATQAKFLLVASGGRGRFSVHGNGGYTVSSGGDADLADEINYAAGFDVAVHPRVTLAVDAVGRVLRDTTRLELGERTLRFTTASSSVVQSTTRPDLATVRDDLNILLGSAGLRFNPVGNLLITVNALFSLSDDGLQDQDVIPLIGLDYSF
jgi:hypothetical protein